MGGVNFSEDLLMQNNGYDEQQMDEAAYGDEEMLLNDGDGELFSGEQSEDNFFYK